MDRHIEAGDTPDAALLHAAAEYHTPYLSCPATVAIEHSRAKKRTSAADEADRKAGREPEAWRTWLTFTDAEGVPDFSD